MKSFPNIEKSAFRPALYVGYAHGVWRISRWTGRPGVRWVASHRDGLSPTIFAATLGEMSKKLEAIAALPLSANVA